MRQVALVGTDGNDAIVIGSKGANVNADDDLDVTTENVGRLDVHAGAATTA